MKVDGSRERPVRKGPNRLHRAWAVVFAACAHVIALLYLGWRVPDLAIPPSNEDREAAIEVTLVRPAVRPRAAPRAGPRRPAPSAPPAQARVLVAPAPDATAPNAPEERPQAQAEIGANGRGQDAAGPGLLPSLSGRMGCDDPPGQRLTSDQRQTCENNAARLAEETNRLALNISADKKAAYDRYVYCAKLHKGAIPSPSDNRGLGAAGGQCLMGTW